MDLAQLKRAMTGNVQATQSLKGLDEKYNRATALRDAPGPQINEYGTVSPFAVIADMVGKSSGRKQMREIGTQREDLRSQIGQGEAALQGNTLELAMAKNGRDQESHEGDMLKNALDLKNAKTKEARDERTSLEGEGMNRWVNKDNPKDVIMTRLDSNHTPFTQNPETGAWDIPVDSSKYVAENKYAGRGSGRGGYSGVSMNVNAQGKLSQEFHTASVVGELAGTWSDDYSQISGLPTGFADKLVTGLQKQGILDYMGNPEVSQKARDAVQWWADWRMNYTGPARHKYFGATLTNNELRAWEEAEAVSPGMPAKEIKRRLDRIHELSKISILRRANVGLRGRAADQEIFKYLGEQQGMSYNEEDNLFSYGEGVSIESPPMPEGVSQVDWDDLTREEQIEYVEVQGG